MTVDITESERPVFEINKSPENLIDFRKECLYFRQIHQFCLHEIIDFGQNLLKSNLPKLSP